MSFVICTEGRSARSVAGVCLVVVIAYAVKAVRVTHWMLTFVAMMRAWRGGWWTWLGVGLLRSCGRLGRSALALIWWGGLATRGVVWSSSSLLRRRSRAVAGILGDHVDDRSSSFADNVLLMETSLGESTQFPTCSALRTGSPSSGVAERSGSAALSNRFAPSQHSRSPGRMLRAMDTPT